MWSIYDSHNKLKRKCIDPVATAPDYSDLADLLFFDIL